MNHRDMRIKYFLLGWGVPTVIVVVSLAAKFPNYGHGPQYRYGIIFSKFQNSKSLPYVYKQISLWCFL